MNTQETKKDNRTPVYHIGLVREGRKLIIQAKESVDDLSCEITDYLGQRQVSKATIEANKAILLAGFKALPKYRNCDMVEVQEQEAKYIPNKFEQIAYIERMQKALTKLNEALHHLDIVWQQDVDADMDMNDFLSDCYPFDPSFGDFTLEADVWYQKAWTALNKRKQVLMGFPVEKVYREGYMTNGVSNCVQSAYNVMKAKNDEVHEEDYEYLKKEVDSLAKETEARMWEIRRLRALVREQSTEIMVLKSLINRYFVLHVWADVEPSLHPVTAYADLITKAREMRKSDDEESSYYKLIITDGEVSVDTYTNDELDGEAEVNEQPVRYIVIEKQDPYFPAIVTDEEGTPKVFHSLRRAEEEAEDCQDAQIVEMHEPPAPYFTPEEAAGKWICAFDTMCRGWDCVRGSKGEKDDVPYLYNSKEEVEEDDFFDPDDDFAIPATEFIEGRKAVWGVDGLHITGIPIVIGYKIQGNDVVKAEEPEVKYNQIIRVAKAWQSNEYYPEDVDIIELILDFKDRLRLMEAQEKCKLYGYDYIAMRAGMGARLLSHDGELSEMRTDVEYFKCYKTGIYFYAQNKYDATCQIESEVMIVTEGLGIELPDHIEYEVPQQ